MISRARRLAHQGLRTGPSEPDGQFAVRRGKNVEVVTIGTGGTDLFHAPARALYDSLGCVPVQVAVYFKHL